MSLVTAPLPRRPESVGAARLLVAEHVTALSASRRLDAAVLVSELVTNALRHGTGAITLRVRDDPNVLWVEVADEGSGTLTVNRAPGADGGWGLHIVDELADEWGTHGGSTRVWFTMAATS